MSAVLYVLKHAFSGGSSISQTEGRTPGFGSVTSLAGVEAMFVHAQNLVALDSNEPRYNSRRGSARRCAPSLDPPLALSICSSLYMVDCG